MSLSIHITGLTNDRVKQAAFALRRKDAAVANAYISGTNLVESLTYFLAKEMDSVRKDIYYWKSLMTAGSTLIKMTMEYIKIYRNIKISVLNFANIATHTETAQQEVGQFEQIEDHIAILRSRLESLANLLVLVYDASIYLKLVSIHIETASTRALEHSVGGFHADIAPDCIDFASLCIEKCFKKISTGFADKSPNLIINKSRQTSFERFMTLASPHFAKAKTSFTAMETQDNLRVVQDAVERILDAMRTGDPEYPIGTTEINSRRPTVSERYWLLNLTVLIGGLFTGIHVYKMVLDGSLQQMITHAVESLRNSAVLHIVAPAQKLCSELFETISRRQEGIVTHKDLEESRKTLAKMLLDYDEANKKSGSVFSSVSVLGGTKSDKTDVGATPISSEEAVMDSLMRSYEDDMKSPIVSMVTGNLMTRLLIQMQKLKLHTESALLTMDQVLASNQLTMAGTAAMPALCFLGFAGYNIYHYLFPPPVKTGKATLQLRLVMADVERSLLDAYDSDRRVVAHGGSQMVRMRPEPAAYFEAPNFGETYAEMGGAGVSASIGLSRSLDSVNSAMGSHDDLAQVRGNTGAMKYATGSLSGSAPINGSSSAVNASAGPAAAGSTAGVAAGESSVPSSPVPRGGRAGTLTTQTPFQERKGADLTLELEPPGTDESGSSNPLLPSLYSRYASPEHFAQQHFGSRANSINAVAGAAATAAAGLAYSGSGATAAGAAPEFRRLSISRSVDDGELNAFFENQVSADQLMGESGGRPKLSVVKRGMMYFHLYRLRTCFSHLFRPRSFRQSPTWSIFSKEYWAVYSDKLSSFGPSGQQWPTYSMLSLFFSLLLREDREYFSHDSEFRSILKDLSELFSPDFEISGERKLAAANRMRLSYQCLMPAP